MIYQEINLPIWAQLLIMALLILIGIELAKIKPRENVKQEIKEATRRARKRAIRGLYSITGTLLQLRRYTECTSKKKTVFIT